jgi:hypothetical protein
MGTHVSEALEALRRLGTPAEMRALADRGYGPASPQRVNAHIHLPPNFSAFDSVEQALALAADDKIGVLGVSNYYDYDVYGEFVDRARKLGIFPLFGLEIIAMQPDLRDAGIRVNDPGNPGKTYLCGKGITRFDDPPTAARRLIDMIRHNDRRRMAAMIDRMRNTLNSRGLDIDVDEQAVIDMVVERHGSPQETVYLQERHISQAFQEEFFERVPVSKRIGRLTELLGAAPKLDDPTDHVGVQNELRSHWMKSGKPAFVEESFLSFAEARQLVLELGGIPSYPVLADGASPICEFEADPEDLIEHVQQRGVYAVEWIPVRNQVSVVVEYVTKMRAEGLAVTAGTEHNTLDLIPLNPSCKNGEVPPEIRQVFWEGACVVAAHQFLSLHGEIGYVDFHGRPNADYPSADERIRSMANLGAAVIQRYYEACAAG